MPTFLPSLKKLGHLDSVHITIASVGSRKLGAADDYASQAWQFFIPNLTIYGFDADADACEAANAELQQRQISWKEQHVPLAISNKSGESTLYVTKHPMCSSLYPPNEEFLARFSGLPELVNLDFTVEMETTTLKKFCEEESIKTIDFLQIDVQGADLAVLEGAGELLEKSALAVQIEVEFSPLYSGQPLFADVDSFLRKKEFSLFDLYQSRRLRKNSPIASRDHPGQTLWGEAFYFCDLLQSEVKIHKKDAAQLFKLACIADALDFADYALELLIHLTLEYSVENPNYNFADVIAQTLSQFPELVEDGLEKLEVFTQIQPFLTTSPIA